MSSERHVIEPITTSRQLRFLEDAQLDTMREATLDILENVDVRFDSEKALGSFPNTARPLITAPRSLTNLEARRNPVRGQRY